MTKREQSVTLRIRKPNIFQHGTVSGWRGVIQFGQVLECITGLATRTIGAIAAPLHWNVAFFMANMKLHSMAHLWRTVLGHRKVRRFQLPVVQPDTVCHP